MVQFISRYLIYTYNNYDIYFEYSILLNTEYYSDGFLYMTKSANSLVLERPEN